MERLVRFHIEGTERPERFGRLGLTRTSVLFMCVTHGS